MPRKRKNNCRIGEQNEREGQSVFLDMLYFGSLRRSNLILNVLLDSITMCSATVCFSSASLRSIHQMGACQSVGGASTSGQGLTAKQVVRAIACVIEAQKKRQEFRRQEHNKQRNGQHTTGEQPRTRHVRQPSVLYQTIGDVPEEAFGEMHTHQTSEFGRDILISSSAPELISESSLGREESPPEGQSRVEGKFICVTEYAPEVFRFLRRIEGIEEEEFCADWEIGNVKLETGEGRSGALFLPSLSKDYLCKTIGEAEVSVLQEVLRRYTYHMDLNTNTLLMRYLMLLKVEVDKTPFTDRSERTSAHCHGYVLCFCDVFAESSILHEKWDLKGRNPKPGKFTHHPKLVAKVDQHGKEVLHGDAKTQSTDVTPSKTEPSSSAFLNNASEATVTIEKLPVQKDKDLTRLFWVSEENRGHLIAQLLLDFSFLGSLGLMDYSVLIGVTYNQQMPPRAKSIRLLKERGRPNLLSREIRPRSMGSATGAPSQSFCDPLEGVSQDAASSESISACVSRQPSPEIEVPPSLPQRTKHHNSSSKYRCGLESIGGDEIYYIGIIDMLTFYAAKKKVANFCKSFLWSTSTLSTIPPHLYQERISKYVDMIFPSVAQKLHEGHTESSSK